MVHLGLLFREGAYIISSIGGLCNKNRAVRCGTVRTEPGCNEDVSKTDDRGCYVFIILRRVAQYGMCRICRTVYGMCCADAYR